MIQCAKAQTQGTSLRPKFLLMIRCARSTDNSFWLMIQCAKATDKGFQLTMGDLAADRPAWWRWAYLGFWQSSSQLQMISPTLARWRWAYLGSAMLKPAKSLIQHAKATNKSFWLMIQCAKTTDKSFCWWFSVPKPQTKAFGWQFRMPKPQTKAFSWQFSMPKPQTKAFGGWFSVPKPQTEEPVWRTRTFSLWPVFLPAPAGTGLPSVPLQVDQRENSICNRQHSIAGFASRVTE